MGRIINILVLIPILIMGCNKNNKIQTTNEDIADVSAPISTEMKDQEGLNKIMYVNSPEGLRVRNLPSMNGDRIGLLDHLTEVKIIKEDNDIVSIEGIEGKWVNIITPIEGWIFNGFLSLELQHIRQESLEKRGKYPYILELGKYYWNDWKTIHEEPNYSHRLDAQSRLIGQFEIYGEIDIIEYMGRGENSPLGIIDWYKVKYGDIEGYTSIETYAFDIDNNGIEDYFFYRLSRDDYGKIKLLPTDIFIYINNKRISTEIFEEIYLKYNIESWDMADIGIDKDDTEIVIRSFPNTNNGLNFFSFKISSEGLIYFIEAY